ncbi:hypothetical protein AGOR_G00187640 [Albula goreensis]|uniref:Uncharacterized protein n=1 Tax=Albula goreensis TaxID=1534307 RepID=A0A8T3CX74_9TELE|nr:hypothetical protein AGOR_G00187640 [Albula goreensis]
MKHGNNYRMKKGRRFTLPITSPKSSKGVNDHTEKGADLFKGREGEEDEQTDMEEYRQQQKKGKKFKIHFLQRKDSKGVNDHTEKGADLFKGREGEEDEQTDMEEYRQQQKKGKKFKIHFLLQRDSKGVNDHTEKGADLFKGREGEEDEQIDMEEYRQQQKKGKRSKIHFLQPRDPNGFEVPETPPGATCSNYHLSEAAEAEWLSAQRDEVLMRGRDLEDAVALEDGDTDSLMEWWNTVEQWDEVPSDEDSEKLPEEKELKQCKVLVEKVQKGIHVFNKVFMEQAEGLWQHVIDLNTVAENISEFHKKAKIASITGGTTSAVGGVTAIAGLALAPVTLGASLIITAVGIGVATAGGLTSASATISDTVNNSHDRRKVERIVQDYQAKMADVGKCLRYVQQGLERLQALSPALGPAHMPDPTLRRAVLMASEAGGTADRAVEIVSETGSELSSLSLGMDSYYAGNNSRELKKDCKTEFVYKIREVAEHLNQGLVELNSIREELHDAVYNI